MTSQPRELFAAHMRVPWYKSLFFRVVVLCAVLLLCLFGSVIVITHHFFQEAAREMEAQAGEIAHTLEIRLEEGHEQDYAALEMELMDLYQGVDITLDDDNADMQAASFTIERLEDGGFARVARVPLRGITQPLMMTVTMTILPQTEVLRAFQNRYMMALTVVFVLALGLMVYFIGKALRPLARLSESCAAIGDGELNTVNIRGVSGEIRALEQTFNDMVASLREKETMEKKLRQTQRLSALGNLAAGIAHDVRNPLNAIKLLSSHASDMLDDGAHPAVKPMAAIREEVDRLDSIVSNFLSLARETELHREPRELDALLQECVRLFRKDAEARGVRLISELRAPGLVLLLDPKQWTRAVLNVILNALEACPEGGRVRIFSRVSDSACSIEIRDDGPGLAPETAERVFEPYFTTRPGGTGLGLSITKSIIEEHGGTIDLSSSPGMGCQVLITLPLEKVKP